MLPRPPSVLDDPALFGRRRPAPSPTGMMAIGADDPAKPGVNYGFEFPSRNDEEALYKAMDAENPAYPLTSQSPENDRLHMRNKTREGMYAFSDRMKQLDKETAFLEAALKMLQTQFLAGKLLEEKRVGIEGRLGRRLAQITEAKMAMTQPDMANFNREYYMDTIAIHHLLDKDIEAAYEIAHNKMIAEQLARGIEPGYRDLGGGGGGGGGGFRVLG
jgi:hypothetical protein